MTAGLYGAYGGRYVPETLVPALDELERSPTDRSFAAPPSARSRRECARAPA
jgi:tryptophan synthase beta subunit